MDFFLIFYIIMLCVFAYYQRSRLLGKVDDWEVIEYKTYKFADPGDGKILLVINHGERIKHIRTKKITEVRLLRVDLNPPIKLLDGKVAFSTDDLGRV